MKTDAPSLLELFLNRQLASAEVPFLVCKDRSSLEGFKHLPSYPFLQSPLERIDTAMMFPVADAQLKAWQPTPFQTSIMDGYLGLYASFIHKGDELEQEDKPKLKKLSNTLQKAKEAIARSDFSLAFRNLQRLEQSLAMLSRKLGTALFPYDYLPVAFALGLVDLALGEEQGRQDTSAARERFRARLRELFSTVEADTQRLLESYRAADDIDTAMTLASLVDKHQGTHLAEELEDVRQLKEQVKQSLQADILFLAKLKEQFEVQEAIPGS